MPISMREPFVRLHPADNVVIALEDLSAGTALSSARIEAREDVPAGHKIAARAIAAGEPIVKGHAVIGHAACAIAPGARVHAHNVTLQAAASPDAPVTDAIAAFEVLPAARRARFDGIVREDGRVATRNYIGIFVTVNCAATTARRIAEHFTEERLAAYPNVDGVVSFAHELGCGMEMTGEPMDLLRRTIGGYVRHPNIGAALICSLGCERNNLHGLLEREKLQPGPRLATLVMQERGGTLATIEAGIAEIDRMLPLVNDARREPVSAEHLVVALQSSGSDAFSGLTANPSLGAAVDLVVRHGGTAILSGTSELAGVEASLEARAASPEVRARLAQRIEWWKAYREGRDTAMNARLARASEAAGLSTMLERAIASAQRWGRQPLADVCEYAHAVRSKGLVFMDTPAHAAIAVTGQIAGGANMVCMTTGSGTGFGALPAPTLKLASNSAVFRRMADDLDIDCGEVLDAGVSVEAMGERIFAALLRHASGEKTRAEELGMGESEFVPWPIGITA